MFSGNETIGVKCAKMCALIFPFFRNDTIQKKIYIIIVILSLCIFGAIILSFVNIHDDFMELSNFYRGYMGRRLMIQERRLVYRGQGDRVSDMQVIILHFKPFISFFSIHTISCIYDGSVYSFKRIGTSVLENT